MLGLDMLRKHLGHRRLLAMGVACLLWAIPIHPQEESVPRGILAGELDTGQDPNARPTEVRLKSVMRGGPADLAGLRAGDVILKLGDEPVTLDTWTEFMRDFPPGSQMKVTYLRDGQSASTTVTVGDRLETYTRLATAGDPEAAVRAADVYWSGQGAPKNKEEALRWYRRAAEMGNASAQLALGSIYYRGGDVPKDFAEALRWYRRAAEQGNAEAANQAGWMYAHAEGTPLNGPEAVRWLSQAAAANHSLAQLNLGLVYNFGLGVAKSPEQAALWYRKAADAGNPAAMNNLGVLYVNGEGGTKSIYEGISWYRKAAEKNEPYGQKNLAANYFNGTGVAQDYAESYFWWSLAKANGYSQSEAALETLPQKLTAQQASEVQRRVAAWMSANVTLTTEPPLASVYFNNQFRGTSDANGRLELHDLPGGEYTVRVSASGYLDLSRTYFFPAHSSAQPTLRLRPATADLRLQTTPGGAQIYVNDEFKGSTSGDGTLVVARLPKGSYRVRVSLAGYNDWNQDVEVKPGPSLRLEAKLERAGPPLLSVEDVLGLLQGSVTPVRVATLVKERGVDFDLNNEVEKRIRGAGGDSDLLLVIARSRKK